MQSFNTWLIKLTKKIHLPNCQGPNIYFFIPELKVFKILQLFLSQFLSSRENLRKREIYFRKYGSYLDDLGFSLFKILILEMREEFFKNSHLDWNFVWKAAEFASFCNKANVLRRSDQSHSNYVLGWITRITSQPFGNLIICIKYLIMLGISWSQLL